MFNVLTWLKGTLKNALHHKFNIMVQIRRCEIYERFEILNTIKYKYISIQIQINNLDKV